MTGYAAFGRFFIVTLAGLGVDLATSWLVLHLFAPPLALAAAIGFLAGAGFNYLLHEIWTFGGGAGRLSGRRFGKYLAVLGIVLVGRLAAVAALSRLALLAEYPMAILVLASGVSMLLNFALSRGLVFTAPRVPKEME
ncbi:GtrA family protein [Pseudothioclava arenosa]|uniref:GtrA/DPMS transmembrane domain-containing protein n=1 Tax=Pseudothioclava arenosa TaxID=1795308 RepID=A0A2A4CNE6_9RHOB|nr:GtrA family protein [Pseudothioclava arenosa]PCD75782.1 hypothetical protein CLN94_11520 [Pseudothioclava arenosa]